MLCAFGWWGPWEVSGQEFLTPESESSLQICNDLIVSAGESAILDCPFANIHGIAFRWTSEDARALKNLSNVAVAAPRFHAPVGLTHIQQFTFYRIETDPEGKEAGRVSVQIFVYPNLSDDCRLPDGTPLKGEDLERCNEVNAVSSAAPEAAWTEQASEVVSLSPVNGALNRQVANVPEAPRLRCDPSVTVESHSEAVITCSGQSLFGGFLEYTAEFDWPPFSETIILPSGEFDFTVRAPAIDDATDVYRLRLTALDHQSGLTTVRTVEVHVVNTDPVLACDDLVVDEGAYATFPCTAEASGAFQYQFIPQARFDELPWGLYDQIPSFVAPDVNRDTTISVIVRVVQQEAGRVAQQELSLLVRDQSGSAMGGLLDLMIDCEPKMKEVYEAWDDILLECSVTSGQDGDFVWTWAAQGDTPLEPLLPSLDDARRATFVVPESVDEDTFFEYSVTASSDDLGVSNSVDILITVLERPDIAVACEDVHVRTGDPPAQLSCTATNEKNLPLSYTWQWMPTDRLLGDLTATGMPLFDVPQDQAELFLDYVYEVSASATDADEPEMPTTLTVTVEKILGTLTLVCVTPVEVYEGSNDVELDCTVGGAQPNAELSWTWQPQAGSEDLLRAHPDNFSGPIFQVPASVPSDQVYEYAVSVHARNYVGSEPQIVSINVLTRPDLALDCETDIVVNVGDPPRRLLCKPSNSRGIDLDYGWNWSPSTHLAETDTPTPLFEVPVEQREASVEYAYVVTLTAPHAVPVTAPVLVTVLNPGAAESFDVAVATSAIDFGKVGPIGTVSLDPGTERISGLIHGGISHTGRLLITARDSLSVGLEMLRPVPLRPADAQDSALPERSLILMPQWSHAETCVTLAPESQAETYIWLDLEEGDCHLIRFGGDVVLDGAPPGNYEGEISVLLTQDGIDETYIVPVSLTVEEERRVVSLGPAGARFSPETVPTSALDDDQRIRIYPLVAALSPNELDGAFEVSNPSIVPLEISVSTEFGYLEAQVPVPEGATPMGAIIADPEGSPLGDLSGIISVHPKVLLLMPGEVGHIRYAADAIQRGRIGGRGYAAQFSISAVQRQYARQDQLPVIPDAVRSARVLTRIPGVYVPGDGPTRLSAELESVSSGPLQGFAATLLIETEGVPFVGQVVVRGENEEDLGKSDLLVYTRSRVRVPLITSPSGHVTLHFIPRTETPVPPPVRLSIDS